MNINEILAQINALHWAATQGEWQIDQDSVSEWSMYGGGGLISDAWLAISAELKRLQDELGMASFERDQSREAFDKAMTDVRQQQAVIEKAREAMGKAVAEAENVKQSNMAAICKMTVILDEALAALDGLASDAVDGWVKKPDKPGVYVWRNTEACAIALVLVRGDRGCIMRNSEFFDGCDISQWNGI